MCMTTTEMKTMVLGVLSFVGVLGGFICLIYMYYGYGEYCMHI